MNITFGLLADGAAWSREAVSLGEIAVGPMSFLAWLEARTGLAGEEISTPERINEIMRKIKLLAPGWCKVSFELDPWSTAKQILAWRDELVSLGWDGKTGGTPRLDTIATLESAPGTLSPGVPDRMKRVHAELEHFTFTDTLILNEPRTKLPYLWKKIVDALEKCGMTVLQAEQPQKPEGQEICVVTGADEFALAAECVRYLTAGKNDSTAVVSEAASSILDGALHRSGIGRIGSAEKSRWRESLQILPLWLETLWKPFNPQRFLELLSLPFTPIPNNLAHALTNAITKHPGIGGEAWNKAWQDLLNKVCPDGKKTQNPEAMKLDAAWTYLNEHAFRAKNEVEPEYIIHCCDTLVKQLSPLVEEHRELALSVTHAQTLKKIVATQSTVTRQNLARILDSIISTGTTGDPASREVTDFAVYATSGAVDQDYDTIIWWNFIDLGAASATAWTPDEAAILPGYNRSAIRELENLAWHNAQNHAKKRLICFIPDKIDGEQVFTHPLFDEFGIDIKNALKADQLVNRETGVWHLADRSATLKKRNVFEPAVSAEIGRNQIRPVWRLSYSQMNTLLSCPFQWFMNDYLELKMPPAMNVPTGA